MRTHRALLRAGLFGLATMTLLPLPGAAAGPRERLVTCGYYYAQVLEVKKDSFLLRILSYEPYQDVRMTGWNPRSVSYRVTTGVQLKQYDREVWLSPTCQVRSLPPPVLDPRTGLLVPGKVKKDPRDKAPRLPGEAAKTSDLEANAVLSVNLSQVVTSGRLVATVIVIHRKR